MEKKHHFTMWYFIAALWALLLIQDYYARSYGPKALPYSEFLTELKAGHIEEVAIGQGSIQGKM